VIGQDIFIIDSYPIMGYSSFNETQSSGSRNEGNFRMTQDLPKLSRLIDVSPQTYRAATLLLQWVDQMKKGMPDESLLDEAIEISRDAVVEATAA
jgi:hypothetical protein